MLIGFGRIGKPSAERKRSWQERMKDSRRRQKMWKTWNDVVMDLTIAMMLLGFGREIAVVRELG